MFTHPEVKQQFVIEKFALHHANPKWSMDAVEEAARTLIWARALEDTNVFLKDHCFCPGLITPVEEFERYLQMEEVLDETQGEFGDDE